MGQTPSRTEFLDELIKQVDAASEVWRQGDILLDAPGLLLADLSRPITSYADDYRAAEELSTDLGTDYEGSNAPELGMVSLSDSLGQAIITQTCDVVRSARKNPYLQLCPVIRVEGNLAATARKYETPQLAWLPGSGADHFADLTRVSTVEKSILLGRTPIRGVPSFEDAQNFSEVVSRRYGRFAFPNDFQEGIEKLARRIKDKHGKRESSEGACLLKVHQIRAQAFPDWDADSVEVVLHFVLHPGTLPEVDEAPLIEYDASDPRTTHQLAEAIQSDANREDPRVLWHLLIESWVRQCSPRGRIRSFHGYLSSTDTFTLEQMRHNEQVDLDHLSLLTS